MSITDQFQSRIAHTCCRENCAELAVYMPVLELRPWKSSIAAPAMLGIGVCPAHKESCTAADFISDEGWAQIERGFAAIGKAIPRRELTTLRWEPIQAGRG